MGCQWELMLLEMTDPILNAKIHLAATKPQSRWKSHARQQIHAWVLRSTRISIVITQMHVMKLLPPKARELSVVVRVVRMPTRAQTLRTKSTKLLTKKHELGTTSVTSARSSLPSIS